jgi:hypothetical protein
VKSCEASTMAIPCQNINNRYPLSVTVSMVN